MVKLAMLYFVESVLLGKENKNYINETNVLIVNNLDRVAKHKKKSIAYSKYKGATYSVHGFLHAFLVIKLN